MGRLLLFPEPHVSDFYKLEATRRLHVIIGDEPHLGRLTFHADTAYIIPNLEILKWSNGKAPHLSLSSHPLPRLLLA